jgi:HEAT repeat protein
MIPSLIKRLDDENSDVRKEAVQLIDKLKNHSEWQLNSITAQLIKNAKSSFVERSRAQFHCLLSRLRMRTVTCEETPFS